VKVLRLTQGSGKSFSMVFFAQKMLRKLAGNWTFVVVTDRAELISRVFAISILWSVSRVELGDIN
jgi:hypothetical protein